MSAPVAHLVSTAAPLLLDNVDTDQIMPKQFLKRIERSGFGPYIFHEWRHAGDFVLDTQPFDRAEILLAGANFGCGSSREQAVWGLLDAGIKVVLAPSFAPIFEQNSLRAGLLTIAVPKEPLAALAADVTDDPTARVEIDLHSRDVRCGELSIPFDVSQEQTEVFVNGVDFIERTLKLEDAISSHESRRESWMPSARALRPSDFA